MPYSSVALANNVLSRAFAENTSVSPMKLQKILYFVASEYRKATGRDLFGEPFQTWAYGPVLYSVYDQFSPFSKRTITSHGRDANGEIFVINEAQDPDLKSALDRVWEATRDRSAVDLSEVTHVENSAWDKAFQEGEEILDPQAIGGDFTYGPLLKLEPHR